MTTNPALTLARELLRAYAKACRTGDAWERAHASGRFLGAMSMAHRTGAIPMYGPEDNRLDALFERINYAKVERRALRVAA